MGSQINVLFMVKINVVNLNIF